jgi:hypothetical protein
MELEVSLGLRAFRGWIANEANSIVRIFGDADTLLMRTRTGKAPDAVRDQVDPRWRLNLHPNEGKVLRRDSISIEA